MDTINVVNCINAGTLADSFKQNNMEPYHAKS